MEQFRQSVKKPGSKNLPSINEPEFQQINSNMTLEEYKYIFYMEWIHRFIARMAGLVYAIPVFYFLFRGTIPLRNLAFTL